MKAIIDLLLSGGYSCVISNRGDVRTFSRRGVIDLYTLLREGDGFLNGASVADKIVGKAAAALMILGGVREVYADTISLPALTLFSDTDIRIEYANTAPYVCNRDKSGWCPLETACRNEKSPEKILHLIENFLKKLELED